MPPEISLPIDRPGIERLIPHRSPFLYLDRIVRVDADGATAELLVAGSEPFVLGHYPGNPIMPGVLILESIFQTGAWFLAHRLEIERQPTASSSPTTADGVPVLTRIGGAKFKRIVRPGDTLRLDVRLVERIANAFVMAGKATGPAGMAASVDFTCALLASVS